MKKYIFTICVLFIAATSYSQTECTQYHRKGCGDKDGMPMKYDSQSKSAIMGKGQSSEFHLVAYHNLDYRITVCAEANLGDQIQFRIYEKTKVLVKEEETSSEESDDSYDEYGEETTTPKHNNGPRHKIVKELLYDNADDGFSNKLEFTAESAMSLIIEVKVPGSDGGSKLKIRETGCVGVLIEHAKSQKIGFD